MRMIGFVSGLFFKKRTPKIFLTIYESGFDTYFDK